MEEVLKEIIVVFKFKSRFMVIVVVRFFKKSEVVKFGEEFFVNKD